VEWRPHSSWCLRMSEPGEEPRPRPSPGAFFSNWTSYDASSAVEVRMAVSNSFIKLRKRQAAARCHRRPWQSDHSLGPHSVALDRLANAAKFST
jgi:hypothetical protein